MKKINKAMKELTTEVKSIKEDAMKMAIEQIGCKDLIELMSENPEAIKMMNRSIKSIDTACDILDEEAECLVRIEDNIESLNKRIDGLDAKLNKIIGLISKEDRVSK